MHFLLGFFSLHFFGIINLKLHEEHYVYWAPPSLSFLINSNQYNSISSPRKENSHGIRSKEYVKSKRLAQLE